MRLFFSKNRLTLIGIVLGALAGYFYWQQAGCVNGTCFITSHPLRSSAYGALMGGLLFSMFKPSPQKSDQR
ncbi:MAG: DUF6132 family protein [Ferruginibacter sp.]